MAKEELREGVMSPRDPPLFQGHRAEVDDARQCAIGAEVGWALGRSFPLFRLSGEGRAFDATHMIQLDWSVANFVKGSPQEAPFIHSL